MKVLFLDFDGVISYSPKWMISDDKINYIKKIIDVTDAKIVITSSWRCGTPTDLEKTKNYILEEYSSEAVHWLFDNSIDVTPIHGKCRGDEIKKWMTDNEVENYVILDDDSDFLPEQVFHFVQTDWSFGITEIEAERAIKILNNEYVQNISSLNYVLKYEFLKQFEGLPNEWDELIKYNDLSKNF